MTPEHLPTEQYEAQLAEKSRPFANHDGAFCRAGSGSVSFAGQPLPYARRVPSVARWRRSVPYYFRSADPVADSR